MRPLLALRPVSVIHRHRSTVLPLVAQELSGWERLARAIPDPELRREALSSLRLKRFHCEGGSVFAAWEPRRAEALARFIVAFQTISDYLDNLCDRTGCLDPARFRRLHRALEDAVDLRGAPRGDYYGGSCRADRSSAGSSRDPAGGEPDGGYLRALVEVCRSQIETFPGWAQVEGEVRRLVGLYVDLQVYKHVEESERVRLLEEWYRARRGEHSALHWWEFAAASGSTLGVFALAAEAARPRPVEALDRLISAYFPWIAALHILLDYFVDQEEDAQGGDLNFVRFYPGEKVAGERMAWIAARAARAASGLRDAGFHRTVVDGLLGLYLSDPKVARQGLERRAEALVRSAGWRARAVRAYCRRWRAMQGLSRKAAAEGAI